MDTSRFTIKPESTTCECIICHQKGVEASDEHIIPKSIGGYLHTWNVCKTCNTKFGTKVDPLLVDQFFVGFERHKHQLKGYKSKHIKSPLEGKFTAQDNEEYFIEDENGVLTPHIVPKVTKSDDGKQFSICVDARDRDMIPAMVNKICKRMGVEPPKELPELKTQTAPSPGFEISASINFSEIRLAMLKIAYEFTASIIPEYVEDETAKKIADILHDANPKQIDEIKIGQNILDDLFVKMLGNFIDFTKQTRHYIILFNSGNYLCCYIKLFDLFSVPVLMSEHPYPAMEPTIAINDFGERCCDVFTLTELSEKVYSTSRVIAKWTDPHNKETKEDGKQVNVECEHPETLKCYDSSFQPIGYLSDIMHFFWRLYEDSEIEEGVMHSYLHFNKAIYMQIPSKKMVVPIDEIELITTLKKY